jgi:hypothetical protein
VKDVIVIILGLVLIEAPDGLVVVVLVKPLGVVVVPVVIVPVGAKFTVGLVLGLL